MLGLAKACRFSTRLASLHARRGAACRAGKVQGAGGAQFPEAGGKEAQEEAHNEEMRSRAANVRGIDWRADKGMYRARRSVGGGKMRSLGIYPTLEQAQAALRSSLAEDPPETGRYSDFKPAERQSAYTGVSWHKKMGAWAANITLDGRKLYLGSHGSEREAARAVAAGLEQHLGGKRNPRGTYLCEETGSPISGFEYAKRRGPTPPAPSS